MARRCDQAACRSPSECLDSSQISQTLRPNESLPATKSAENAGRLFGEPTRKFHADLGRQSLGPGPVKPPVDEEPGASRAVVEISLDKPRLMIIMAIDSQKVIPVGAYSLAQAKDQLSRLVDEALSREIVTITAPRQAGRQPHADRTGA